MSEFQLHLPVMLRGGEPSAVVSPCRTYRYRLTHVWDPDKPRLGWVMLAASEAGEHRNDATVRRDIGFAKAWGYGGILVGSLYAVVSTSPARLLHRRDPIGPDNDAYLKALAAECDLVVLAWGDNAPAQRARTVTGLLWRQCVTRGASLAVLGWTQSGQPRHPRHVPANTLPECFTPPQSADMSYVWASHETDDPHWGQLLGGAA